VGEQLCCEFHTAPLGELDLDPVTRWCCVGNFNRYVPPG